LWLSKSKIFAYQFCGKQFQHRYLDKVKVDEVAIAATIGRNLHTLFESYFDEVKLSNGMDVNEATNEIIRALTYCAAPMWGDPESYLDGVHTDADDFRHILESFVYAEIGRANELLPDLIDDFYYPVQLEGKFEIGDIQFRGIIDRIDLDPSNTYTLLDYKTGNVYRNVSKMRKELAFYKIGAAALGYDVTFGAMFFPRHNHVFLEKISKRTMTYAYKTIESVRENIDEGRFPCRVGRWCYTCPYFEVCDYCGEPPEPRRGNEQEVKTVEAEL
jgi:hypothetical protein